MYSESTTEELKFVRSFLTSLYRLQGHHEQAEPLYLQALMIVLSTLSEDISFGSNHQAEPCDVFANSGQERAECTLVESFVQNLLHQILSDKYAKYF